MKQAGSATKQAKKKVTPEKKTQLAKEVSKPEQVQQKFGQLDGGQIQKAANALQKHMELQSKAAGKQQLFENDPIIYLQISLNSVPPAKKAKPFIIPLKHSVYSNADICVFVRDPAKNYKKLIKEADVDNVKKVIGVQKLRNEWGQFEARRKLLNSYDLFLCDDAISLVLTRFLGKQFISGKKFPLGIKMGPGHSLGRQIIKTRDSVPFYLTAGTVQSIPIGRVSFSAEQISENVLGAIGNIVSHIPQRWLNVRQVSLRTVDSVALPIYSAVPTRPEVLKAAALEEKQRKLKEKEAAVAPKIESGTKPVPSTAGPEADAKKTPTKASPKPATEPESKKSPSKVVKTAKSAETTAANDKTPAKSPKKREAPAAAPSETSVPVEKKRKVESVSPKPTAKSPKSAKSPSLKKGSVKSK